MSDLEDVELANARFYCSTHGALYEPDTGRCTAGPCVGDRLTPLPLAVEGATLVVRCGTA